MKCLAFLVKETTQGLIRRMTLYRGHLYFILIGRKQAKRY